MEFEQKQDSLNDPKILEKYTVDLTKLAKEGKIDPVIGREDEILRIIRILSRKTKNNPILIGEPGVGKTAIVAGLAQRIINRDVPSNLKDKQVLELDMGLVMAGASYLGEYESRVKGIINAVKKANGTIILFVDEIHLMVGAGNNGKGGMDVSNLLKPALARGELKMIGATTLDEHRQYIEQDAALERRFQKVLVKEPTVEETISILRGLKERFETFHGVRIHDNALVSAAKLSDRYIADRFLPDKAIDLIDEASATIKTEIASVPTELDFLNRKVLQLEIERAALAREKDEKSKQRLAEIETDLAAFKKDQVVLTERWENEKKEIQNVAKLRNTLDGLRVELQQAQNDSNFERASEIQYALIPAIEKQLVTYESKLSKDGLLKEEVMENEVAAIVSQWTGIPVNKLVESDKKRLLSLNQELQKKIKGQDQALELVSEAILRSRVGIKDPNKPIGSFLFLGPTGVGKTEVARTLADILFSSPKKIIRFDMSEFMDRESVNKLIGAPPGYIGYDKGGMLTEAVRRSPYSIVLFDELEKANRDVINVLLQILDEGRITDSTGKLVDFKNTIIIMTSNIGSEQILGAQREDEVSFKLIMNELKQQFSPEFLNRIDNVIPFNALSESVMKEIISRDLQALSTRLNTQNDYQIGFNDSIVDKVLTESYDRQFGARPTQRYVEKNLETKISHDIIDGKISHDRRYEMTLNQNNEYVWEEKN